MDETFIAVPPRVLAAAFADRATWPRIWPDLRLQVFSDRGCHGLRWTVTGALVGSMEVWLEPVLDGTVLHYFLRADAADPDGSPVALQQRRAAAEARRRKASAKELALVLKRHLEAGRPPGVAP